MPPISHKLPPGDRGILATAEGMTFVALVSGEPSCARFIAPDFAQDMPMKVGEGETVSPGQAL